MKLVSDDLFQTFITLFRQSLKYQSLVEEHLHHGDISSSLYDNLLVSFHNSVELAEQIKHADLQVGKPCACLAFLNKHLLIKNKTTTCQQLHRLGRIKLAFL